MKKIIPAYLKCNECGNQTTIQRRKDNLKEVGHTKHMHCYKCKTITAHTEITEYEYYDKTDFHTVENF